MAVVAGDSIASLSTEEFLLRADVGCRNPRDPGSSPIIPHGYNRYAEWHLRTYKETRRAHLAMVPCLMSAQGARHPDSVTYEHPHLSVQDVLASPRIASITNLFECARRTDGGGAILLASERWMEKRNYNGTRVVVLGGGEVPSKEYLFVNFF